EIYAGFEVPHRQHDWPVCGEPELAPDRTAVRGRLEPVSRRRAADPHDALARHRVELPELVGREVAGHVDEPGAPETRALDRPEHRGARRAYEARPMARRHPPARAVLERRRRVEAVEARQARAGLRGQGTVAGERLMDVQHVDRLLGDGPRPG